MRLDTYIHRLGFVPSREKAKRLIEDGFVSVNGVVVEKPAFLVDDGDDITVTDSPELRYVSRGGLKLEAALDEFEINVFGLCAIDIGASTGGFTDCLLKRGAAHVWAVDSGHDQLAQVLRDDPRVTSLEGVNARSLTADDIGQLCDIVVMDVSFISQTLLYETATNLLIPEGILISLVKPQFEVGRDKIGKGGIVRDVSASKNAVFECINSAKKHGLECLGVIDSPIEGGDGNREYLAMFRLGGKHQPRNNM